jgi:hypothetical protein
MGVPDSRWHRPDLAISLVTVAVAACGENSRPPDALRIGLAEEPRTLNIWLASDANSRKVLSLIYQPLYTNDPETLEPGSLAGRFHAGIRPPAHAPIRSPCATPGGPTAPPSPQPMWPLPVDWSSPSTYRVMLPNGGLSKRIETPDSAHGGFLSEKAHGRLSDGHRFHADRSGNGVGRDRRAGQKTEKPLATLINHRVRHPWAPDRSRWNSGGGGLFTSEAQPIFFRNRSDHRRVHP